MSERFEAWTRLHGAGLAVRRFPEGTRTAADAARAVGCEVDQIVKSLVFLAAGQPVLALVAGGRRLAPARLEAVAGGPIARADAAFVRAATGYAIGGVPPFVHAQKLAAYMDLVLCAQSSLWAAAGRPDAVFEISPARLLELTGATVADISEPA